MLWSQPCDDMSYGQLSDKLPKAGSGSCDTAESSPASPSREAPLMTDTTKPVTLADLDREGKLAWVYCNACGRERDVPPSSLGLPLDTPVPAAGKRLVCSACGCRRVTVRPELYPGGVEAMRRIHRGS